MKKVLCLFALSVTMLLGVAPPARASTIVLDFQDLSIPGDTFLTFFTPYESQGFRLTATSSGGFSSGFVARGANSGGFFAGDTGLATFSPSVGSPDNVLALTQTNGDPFDLLSIDLARHFIFDPAPTVTFTGTLAGGGTVSQTFTVTTPPGVPAFQTFTLAGFTDVVSVSWGQPPLTTGLHQFSNISLEVDTAAVPEPASLTLLGLGVATMAAWRRRAGQAKK